MFELYVSKGSCSMVPHALAHSLGLTFAYHFAPKDGEPTRADYLKINPLGTVPAMVDANGKITTQIAAIMHAMTRKVSSPEAFNDPNALIASPSDALYTEQIRWFTFCNSDLHPAFKPLFRPHLFVGDENQYESVRQFARQRVGVMLSYANQELSARPCLAGAQISVADLYLATAMRWAGNHDVDVSGYEHILRLAKAVQLHPSIKQTMIEHQIPFLNQN